jgi:flagellar biogenesis protein FliO
MKSAASIGLLFLSVLANAQEPGLGTKPDLVVRTPESSSIIGAWDLVQMVVALAIVFALLKWALPKIVSRMNKKLVAKDGSSITVEESASFGGGNLQIVTARGRTLLLSVSQSGVTCLADLTAPKSETKEEPAFFEYVDRAIDDKDRVALDRLDRLTG